MSSVSRRRCVMLSCVLSRVPPLPLLSDFPPVSSSCVSLRLSGSCFILIVSWSMFSVFSPS